MALQICINYRLKVLIKDTYRKLKVELRYNGGLRLKVEEKRIKIAPHHKTFEGRSEYYQKRVVITVCLAVFSLCVMYLM